MEEEQSKQNQEPENQEPKHEEEQNRESKVQEPKHEEAETHKNKKIGFWKKVWYSITKIEKYPEMSAQGFGSAMGYLALIVAILTVVICAGTVYGLSTEIRKGIDCLQNSFPDFSYRDGNLKVDSAEKIEITQENEETGKIIINTNDIDEQTKNEYVNEITKNETGIVLLKNEAIVKVSGISGTITTNYKTEAEKFGIDYFDKTMVVDYANSAKMNSVYLSIFLILFIYTFIMLFILVALNALYISFVGYVSSMLARIKMRYVAIFNMSVYSLTLPIILSIIYVGINIFTPFYIKYFQVMYDTVAVIYVVAAILILKSEVIKKQMELMKIAEVQKVIKEQMEEQEQKEKEQEEKEERKKKDKEEEGEGAYGQEG